MTKVLLPPACLVLHTGHALSIGLLSNMLLMIQHMDEQALYTQPFTALTVPTSTGLMTLPLSVYPGCTPANLFEGHAEGCTGSSSRHLVHLSISADHAEK